MKKLLAILLCMAMLCTASFSLAEPLTGEADGYGGPIQAEVTLDGDKIVALKLTGDKETPSLGGVALEKLTEAILASGTLEGVDVVTGATWTSKGAFAATDGAAAHRRTHELYQQLSAAVQELKLLGVQRSDVISAAEEAYGKEENA